jgi:dephospho-CoA kinase
MPESALLIINGASGAGKTTTAEALEQRLNDIAWVHPDGLWHDTPDATAEAIFERVLAHRQGQAESLTIVDCQIRPSDAKAILRGRNVSVWTSVLIDCPDAVREARLQARGWSGDEFRRVANWARILRDETQKVGHLVVDSSEMTTAVISEAILEHLATWPGLVGCRQT